MEKTERPKFFFRPAKPDELGAINLQAQGNKRTINGNVSTNGKSVASSQRTSSTSENRLPPFHDDNSHEDFRSMLRRVKTDKITTIRPPAYQRQEQVQDAKLQNPGHRNGHMQQQNHAQQRAEEHQQMVYANGNQCDMQPQNSQQMHMQHQQEITMMQPQTSQETECQSIFVPENLPMQTIKVIQQLDEFGKELKEHLFQIPLGAEITDFRTGDDGSLIPVIQLTPNLRTVSSSNGSAIMQIVENEPQQNHQAQPDYSQQVVGTSQMHQNQQSTSYASMSNADIPLNEQTSSLEQVDNGINGIRSGQEPIYVNAKQYHRIMKRREARAKLEREGRIPKKRSVRPVYIVSL
ncbi:hypothetical protein WR25_07153 isoform C [Diploscapter pachys]|uniref:Nuclear transcription factor Y subunit n=1 Tax=Diploscapter pachys TaxID=2018661 RepID=A0A2A2J2A4_9BILA|nr:hypothetical protein WR25_07153 isoform B [Diploscapter pachys]PAV55812.1 hypothetical protein WR25_07153 isoform C [Diploscapter pachys]